MARNNILLVTAVALFVVVAPATALGVPAEAGTEAAATQADDSDELAPGVYENGTVNTTALYRAHSEELRDEGYRTNERLQIDLNESGFVSGETDTESDGENTSARTALTAVGLDYDIEAWTNESGKVVRIERDDNVTYRVYERGPPAFAGPPDDRDGGYGPHHGDDRRGPRDGDDRRGPRDGDGPRGPHDGDGPRGPYMNDGDRMGPGMGMHQGMMMGHGMGPGEMPVPGVAVLFLDKVTENFTVENETTVDDRTAYTLTAPVELDDDVEGNFTGNVSLLVDEDGVVHSANVTVVSEEYASEIRYSLELDELGVDAVEEPDWLDDVPENATTYGPPEDRPGNDGYDEDGEYDGEP